jgi:hypothetical protein
MFKVPAQWRELTIVHEATGEPEKVRVRIAGVGSRYKTDDVKKLVGGAADYGCAQYFMGFGWVNAPSPCLYRGRLVSETTFAFLENTFRSRMRQTGEVRYSVDATGVPRFCL